MTASFRLANAGRLGRGRSIRFNFDGKEYAGVEGDTLASALLANGVHLVGRSFKYHRPRGILSAGAEEPSALVGIHVSDDKLSVEIGAGRLVRGGAATKLLGELPHGGVIDDNAAPGIHLLNVAQAQWTPRATAHTWASPPTGNSGA